VRLAALDLREVSWVDLEGSRLDPGILGFRVRLNLRVLTLCIMSPSCKLRRINVDVA